MIDPLQRFERDAVAAALVVAALAYAASGWRYDVALGVLGGAALMALSYRAIKGGVDSLLAAVAGADRRRGEADLAPPGDGGEVASASPAWSTGRRVIAAVKFFTRYALLAVGAYVMLTRFRLHPVGLVLGATTPFLAAVMQVARIARARQAPGKHPF